MKTEKVVMLGEMPDYVQVSGKPYRLVPVEVEAELTLEDCMKGNKWVITSQGIIPQMFNNIVMYGYYPTLVIAEKVLLYGLLQSVAEKLNGQVPFLSQRYLILLCNNKLEVNESNGVMTSCPLFHSITYAEKAISIFAKSRFDLKKLYQ